MPRYSFCPIDGSRLTCQSVGTDDGELMCCTRCDFVDYFNPVSCVGLFVLDARGVLLGLRAKKPALGKWDILGGFVKVGESAEEAAIREANEETALEVGIVAYLGSIPDVYLAPDKPTLNMIYVARRLSGEPRAGSDVARLEWFPVDAIPTDLAFPHQRIAVEMLHKYLRTGEVNRLGIVGIAAPSTSAISQG